VWRVAASTLLPVSDEEISFQIQQPLKLGHFVQHRQGRATLNDQERRQPGARGAETDSLVGTVDHQLDRTVDCEWCPDRHGRQSS
jgi:hypothetical protein